MNVTIFDVDIYLGNRPTRVYLEKGRETDDEDDDDYLSFAVINSEGGNRC